MENLIEENLDININSSLFSPLSMEEKKSEDVIRPSVGYWANAWRRLNENKVALFSLVMIVIICNIWTNPYRKVIWIYLQVNR